MPLNSLATVKSRLRGVLAPVDRAGLMVWLVGRVVAALSESGVVERIGVVSPEARVLVGMRETGGDLAGMHPAKPMVEPVVEAVPADGSNLNADLERGRSWALARGTDEILVVLADLPLLSADAVRRMVAMGQDECTTQGLRMVLACDRARRGTNALLVHPADATPFAFGEDSLARHLALARSAGIEPVVFETEETSFDVDTPADLRELVGRGLWTPRDMSRLAVAG